MATGLKWFLNGFVLDVVVDRVMYSIHLLLICTLACVLLLIGSRQVRTSLKCTRTAVRHSVIIVALCCMDSFIKDSSAQVRRSFCLKSMGTPTTTLPVAKSLQTLYPHCMSKLLEVLESANFRHAAYTFSSSYVLTYDCSLVDCDGLRHCYGNGSE